MNHTKQLAMAVLVLTSLSGVVACGQKDNKKEQEKGGQKMPPPQVGYIAVQPQPIENTVELAGRVRAYEQSEVRPQASGVIRKRLFEEGSFVQAGQALYELDDSSNRAAMDQVRAALRRQQATLDSLRVKQGRYAQLVGSNAISKQEYDDITAQVRLAEADVAASQATLQSANINLRYSTVRAPISGQTGTAAVTVGALVTANQATPLVTIQRMDPVYVDISQSSAELLRLRQQLSQGKLDRSNNAAVRLKLEDGSVYPVQGRLAFANASVDATTGSVTLRAVFDNPRHLLLPGMFVTAQIVQATIPNGYLIPQAAVTRTPTGQATVFVANNNGSADVRQIETQGVQGANWIVTHGLNPGDRVIVDGVAKVKESQPLQAKPYQPGPQSATPGMPPAGAVTPSGSMSTAPASSTQASASAAR